MFQALKQITKRSLQHIAARYGRHMQKFEQPQLVVLMYHRILPKHDKRAQIEEPGMIVTPETFEMHMQAIQQHFKVISLSHWISAKQKNETLPSRCCAITFDDGWLDNYQYAFPILQKHGLPATIFLVSDMVGKTQLFWPERISLVLSQIACSCSEKWDHQSLSWIRTLDIGYTFGSTPPDQEQLSEIIQNLKQFKDDEIHSLIDEIENALQLNISNQPSLLNWQQMREMSESGLIEAGSHTCNHIRLNDSQSSEILLQEISQSKKNIEQHLGQTVEAFCYPNGDHNQAAIDIVKQHYRCAVTTENGWNTKDSDDYLLHRIGVHDDISADKIAFLARLSGWM